MIEKTLCLSTEHISPTTYNDLRDDIVDSVYVKGYDNWGITVCSEYDDIDVPEDIKRVLDYAQKLGCRFVNLDADEDIIDDLPVYDWE